MGGGLQTEKTVRLEHRAQEARGEGRQGRELLGSADGWVPVKRQSIWPNTRQEGSGFLAPRAVSPPHFKMLLNLHGIWQPNVYNVLKRIKINEQLNSTLWALGVGAEGGAFSWVAPSPWRLCLLPLTSSGTAHRRLPLAQRTPREQGLTRKRDCVPREHLRGRKKVGKSGQITLLPCTAPRHSSHYFPRTVSL